MSRSGYTPRPNPTPIPPQIWNEEPTRCLRVNEHWVGHILGALEVLDQPDTWEGTDEEIQAARDNVNEIMAAFVECSEGNRVIGEISFFGTIAPPEKWLECNGQSVLIEDYPLLFAAIGENFGFSVGGNFVLPDLRFRPPVGLGGLDGGTDYEITLGEKRGQEELSLEIANLPPHSHTVDNTWRFGINGGRNSTTGTAANHNTTLTSSSVGGGVPIPLIQPIIGLMACIYAGE